jgi:prepilin-type N-terminal cleavage/methylation domain-containing protein
MNKLNYKKGFTLIELLVVVAIVGILSAVVLSSVTSARSKSSDAAIKSNLNTVRSQSELFYSNNGNSFLPAGGSAAGVQNCASLVYSGVANYMLARDKTIAEAIVEAKNKGGNGVWCGNSASAWGVAVGLKTSATSSWCVDSSGIAKVVASAPATALNVMTYLCN